MSGDSRFLHLAEQINEWVISTRYKLFRRNDFPYINKCQIKKRKGILGDDDIAQLKEFTSNQCGNDFLTMVYILLEDFESAKRCFGKLNSETRKRMTELPIIYFCSDMKNWI